MNKQEEITQAKEKIIELNKFIMKHTANLKEKDNFEGAWIKKPENKTEDESIMLALDTIDGLIKLTMIFSNNLWNQNKEDLIKLNKLMDELKNKILNLEHDNNESDLQLELDEIIKLRLRITREVNLPKIREAEAIEVELKQLKNSFKDLNRKKIKNRYTPTPLSDSNPFKDMDMD